MGRRGRNRWRPQKPGRHLRGEGEDGEDAGDVLPSSAYDIAEAREEEGEVEGDEGEEGGDEQAEGERGGITTPSKFHLYQKSVQSPRGDISYLQKFFLMYVGGRMPLHLQEDFCGTALLSTEWLRTDPRRTAVGLDLDFESLDWCLENNLNKLGPDGYSRISLFHGNVLHPKEAALVKPRLHDFGKKVTMDDKEGMSMSVNSVSESGSIIQTCDTDANTEMSRKDKCSLPARDIVCAFNYSCCCLHRRADLVRYFQHVLDALSKRGGVFVMDIYGGLSSECKLKLQRRFPDFTYVWEQQEFDIVNRTTRISLHFHMGKKKILRHAFSYHWRLWSLPEIKDCLEEAGFQSVHFWVREMPDTRESMNATEYNACDDDKYEEVSSFQQRDAWNAYIVGVAHR